MRLWSLSPSLLVPMGLIALWRESLLAKKVLEGKTKGYRHHPQLIRFRCQSNLTHINLYLQIIFENSKKRGYNFDSGKFVPTDPIIQIPVTQGQIDYEFNFLKVKLKSRAPSFLARMEEMGPLVNPIFSVIPGDIEPWEKVKKV